MQQQLVALQRANAVRMARAEIRRGVHSGAVTALDVLDEVPDVLAGVTIGEFLTWLPGIGRHRARKILEGHQHQPIVGADVPLGKLSVRTRQRLASSVDEAPVRGNRARQAAAAAA